MSRRSLGDPRISPVPLGQPFPQRFITFIKSAAAIWERKQAFAVPWGAKLLASPLGLPARSLGGVTLWPPRSRHTSCRHFWLPLPCGAGARLSSEHLAAASWSGSSERLLVGAGVFPKGVCVCAHVGTRDICSVCFQGCVWGTEPHREEESVAASAHLPAGSFPRQTPLWTHTAQGGLLPLT